MESYYDKESHNNQKKIAVINDLTGFGRCALTVAIPVISVMGLACCPVPTSILSNHTAFKSCFIDDYTPKMDAYIREWEKLDLKFNGIYSGFLGSQEQMDIVRRFFSTFSSKDTVILIDPVMGDNGKPYRTYTASMCQAMKKLVALGNLITPNVTEACILTDTPYKPRWTCRELKVLSEKLLEMGPKKVVITGAAVEDDGSLGQELGGQAIDGRRGELSEKMEIYGNYCMDEKGGRLIPFTSAGPSRCGTGDLFASIIAADAVNGISLDVSVKKAADFVAKAIRLSSQMKIPPTDGVSFEPLLGELSCEPVL
ncbi:MAG TPA: pyridoxamine kinase [Candidatus Scybalocola faecavium]|nr:pyridoxamine kinase [Candidatus Scybalocola faecavium]